MSRSLVIARVGRESLHRSWIDAGKPREWDLYLSPFEEIGPQDDLDCKIGDVIPGPTFEQQQCLLSDSPYPVSGLATSLEARAKTGS